MRAEGVAHRMSRYVKIDRRYSQPYRLTNYDCLAVAKWVGLVCLWIVANIILTSAHLGVLALGTTGGLIWYAGYCVRKSSKPKPARTRHPWYRGRWLHVGAVMFSETKGKWLVAIPNGTASVGKDVEGMDRVKRGDVIRIKSGRVERQDPR